MTRRALAACLLLAALTIGGGFQQYQISGTVVDHLTNHPIARALVRLTPITGPGQITSLTGEDGRFQFVNVPKGKYRLMAQRRGQFTQAFREAEQYSTAIVTGPGLDSTNIVFPLRVPASISGTVLDEEGEPAQAMSIVLFREMVVEGEKRTMQTDQGTTNSAGQFHFSHLGAGTYYVAVQGRPWFNLGQFAGQPGSREAPDTSTVYPMTFYGDTTDGRTASPLNIPEGASAQVQITVHPAADIHVPIPSSGGRPEWTPQLFVRGPGGARLAVSAMFSSVNGRFEMSGFPAGRYLVSLPSGGEAKEVVQELDIADGVPITAQGRAERIAISGRVVFEGGQAPANRFQLRMIDETAQDNIALAVGADGEIATPPTTIFPGLYSIRVDDADLYVKSLAVKGAPKIGDRIELSDGSTATLSIVLASSGSLSKLDGFAVRDGQPLAGAMVLLVPSDITRSTLYRRDQSDSDGSFGMTGIVPGRYTLLGIDDDGRGLVYKDPAVIQPYLAGGQVLDFPLRSAEPVRITVQPRIQ